METIKITDLIKVLDHYTEWYQERMITKDLKKTTVTTFIDRMKMINDLKSDFTTKKGIEDVKKLINKSDDDKMLPSELIGDEA